MPAFLGNLEDGRKQVLHDCLAALVDLDGDPHARDQRQFPRWRFQGLPGQGDQRLEAAHRLYVFADRSIAGLRPLRVRAQYHWFADTAMLDLTH